MTTPQQIVELLREAAAAYYNGGNQKMDDDTYDGLVDRLKQLDPENPYLEEVGAPVEGAVKLPYAMPSLDKIKPGEDTLKRFLARPGGFVISEKLDGLSALWLPSTAQLLLRGDGIMGQDVSHLVPLGIQGLSKRCPAGTAIRGELILPRSAGVALARSWVNGQVHQKTPDAVTVSKIHFVAYALVNNSFKRGQQIQMMQSYGLELPWFSMLPSLSEAYLSEVLLERRANSLYDTDGIVVALDTVPKSESTATKAKNPKDCVAFKMALADQSAETTVREVLWAPSAQGYLIPRLRFDPVKIGAATIEFCTGHNARNIVAQAIGPGSKIVIRRSGDVIPKLDRVLLATGASLPQGGWAWDTSGSAASDAVHIKTVGITGAETAAKLHYFLKTLEIPGAGPATAAALVEAGITGPAALWAASAVRLSEVLGPKTGAALYANLRTVLAKVSELTLMHASSEMSRGVGDVKLGSLFGVEADPRKWGNVVAPAGWTAESLRVFLAEFPKYEVWRLRELHWIPYPILSAAAHPVAAPIAGGKTICMTGFRDKDIETKATAKGHIFSPSLTGKVNLLLVPDGEVKESEKVKAARAKGTPILSRSEFISQYLS
jgi:NAD-dependent DNA ligase